jgi:hypothetical protein
VNVARELLGERIRQAGEAAGLQDKDELLLPAARSRLLGDIAPLLRGQRLGPRSAAQLAQRSRRLALGGALGWHGLVLFSRRDARNLDCVRDNISGRFWPFLGTISLQRSKMGFHNK